MSSQYYLNVEVTDRPGVLAAVATVFAEHDVSIRSMEQDGLGDEARLVFITHKAKERDMQGCLHDLRHLEVVDQVPLSTPPNSNNLKYLRTKRDKLGHHLHGVEDSGGVDQPGHGRRE